MPKHDGELNSIKNVRAASPPHPDHGGWVTEDAPYEILESHTVREQLEAGVWNIHEFEAGEGDGCDTASQWGLDNNKIKPVAGAF